MKKYDSIPRFGKVGTTQNIEGSYVYVMEKLDGANASFGLIDGELKMFSRNQELSDTNTLRGFYDWVRKNIHPQMLEPEALYFGEWLVTHTVQYKKEHQQKFYLFDIFDTKEEKFLDQANVLFFAKLLNLKTPRVFFDGILDDIKLVEQYVGKSDLTEIPDNGEGIVIKKYSDNNHFFVKMISNKFSEFKYTKSPSINKSDLDSVIDSVLTPQRVEKLIHKKIDLNLLPSEMDVTSTGNVLKTLGSDVVEDIFEEELHIFLDMLRKKISKKTPIIVRQLLEGGTWQ